MRWDGMRGRRRVWWVVEYTVAGLHIINIIIIRPPILIII